MFFPRWASGIVEDSASWRRSTQQIAHYAQQQEWVAVAGEAGSGGFSILKALAIQHISTRTKFFTAPELVNSEEQPPEIAAATHSSSSSPATRCMYLHFATASRTYTS